MNQDKFLHIAEIIEDDAASNSDVERLISDSEMRSIWARYHLVSDLIKGEVPREIDLLLNDNIMRAIQAEPTILAPSNLAANNDDSDNEIEPSNVVSIGGFVRNWAEQATGFAIAASVTIAIVFGVQSMNVPQEPQSAITAIELLEADNLQITEHVAHTPLQENLIDFSRSTSRYGLQRMTPFVSAVNYSVTVPLTLFKPNYNLTPEQLTEKVTEFMASEEPLKSTKEESADKDSIE